MKNQAEEEFRQTCAVLCAAYPDLPRLKTIASVGAYNFTFDGEDVDSKRLSEGLKYLLRSGFLIDPDFDVDVVNFREKRDFLSEDKTYDAVFAAYILAYQGRLTHSFHDATFSQLREEKTIRGYLGTVMSERHYPENWLDRVRTAGAHVVMTYGGLCEINTTMFCPSYPREGQVPYETLIPTLMSERCERDEMGRTILDGVVTDVPVLGLGFCADKDYIKACAPLLTQTSMAQQAKAFINATKQTSSFPASAPPSLRGGV